MTTEDTLGDGDVVLRPLTEENRPALEALRVATAQRAFVSSVTDSLAEAEQNADANPLVFGLYDRETPVGFEEDDDGSREIMLRLDLAREASASSVLSSRSE